MTFHVCRRKIDGQGLKIKFGQPLYVLIMWNFINTFDWRSNYKDGYKLYKIQAEVNGPITITNGHLFPSLVSENNSITGYSIAFNKYLYSLKSWKCSSLNDSVILHSQSHFCSHSRSLRSSFSDFFHSSDWCCNGSPKFQPRQTFRLRPKPSHFVASHSCPIRYRLILSDLVSFCLSIVFIIFRSRVCAPTYK